MWVLILWMSSPYSIGLSDAQQPTLAIHSQEFNSEAACKEAFKSIKALNDGELKLRAVCSPKGNYEPPKQ